MTLPYRPLDQTDVDNADMAQEIKTLREESAYIRGVILELYKKLWDTFGANPVSDHLYEKAEKALVGLRNPLSRSDHPFFSSSCFHEIHDQCPQVCLLCSTPCQCPCHIAPDPVRPAKEPKEPPTV